MFVGYIKTVFPIVTIISSFIVIIVGIFKDNKDAIIAGTTVSGIAGTAYNSSTTRDDEDLPTALQKKRRKSPGLGSDPE